MPGFPRAVNAARIMSACFAVRMQFEDCNSEKGAGQAQDYFTWHNGLVKILNPSKSAKSVGRELVESKSYRVLSRPFSVNCYCKA